MNSEPDQQHPQIVVVGPDGTAVEGGGDWGMTASAR